MARIGLAGALGFAHCAPRASGLRRAAVGLKTDPAPGSLDLSTRLLQRELAAAGATQGCIKATGHGRAMCRRRSMVSGGHFRPQRRFAGSKGPFQDGNPARGEWRNLEKLSQSLVERLIYGLQRPIQRLSPQRAIAARSFITSAHPASSLLARHCKLPDRASLLRPFLVRIPPVPHPCAQ